jgi:hypothetical protein
VKKNNTVRTMVNRLLLVIFVFMAVPVFPQSKKAANTEVTFQQDDNARKVDVFIGGKFFTSFIYPSFLEKPVLYPLCTSTGIEVTRGFPIKPRPGERVDHPHQVGCWFNYGDVNGLDFWNNSYAIPETEKLHYGSIRNVKIVKAEGGIKGGLLVFKCQWVNQKEQVLLDEETTMIFSGDDLNRKMVRITKLKATNSPVKFGDSKEGLFALRVDHAFETPSETPEIYTDASGKQTTVPVLNNEGVNGVYRSSEGKEKDAVWGTRASWVSLTATKAGEEISICLFDDPSNPGYPACWHARGYGLFSVNDIGRKAYIPNESENTLLLNTGETVEFRYMILIKTGGAITSNEMNNQFKEFKSSPDHAATK